MRKEVALHVFDELEKLVWEYVGDPQDECETQHPPLLNVRLDALTEGRSGQRDYRLFVRVDSEVPVRRHSDAIAAVLKEAESAGLNVQVENGGVELTK